MAPTALRYLLRMSWAKTRRTPVLSAFLFVLFPALLAFVGSLPRLGLSSIPIDLGVSGSAQLIPVVLPAPVPENGAPAATPKWSPSRRLVWVDESSSGTTNASALVLGLPGADPSNTVRAGSAAEVLALCTGLEAGASPCFAGLIFHPSSAPSSSSSTLNYTLLFPERGLDFGFSVNKLGAFGEAGLLSLQRNVERRALAQTLGPAAVAAGLLGPSDAFALPFTSLTRADLNRGPLAFLYDFFANTGSASFALALVPTGFWLAQTVATDGESGVRDALFIMGLHPATYAASLVLRYTAACAPMWIVLGGTLAWGIFPSADFLSPFLILVLPSIAAFPATLALVSRWRRARLAGVGAAAVSFILAAIGGQLARVGPSAALRVLFVLAFPPSLLGMGIAFLSRAEQSDTPVTLATWADRLPSQGVSFGELLLACAGSALMYSAAVWALSRGGSGQGGGGGGEARPGSGRGWMEMLGLRGGGSHGSLDEPVHLLPAPVVREIDVLTSAAPDADSRRPPPLVQLLGVTKIYPGAVSSRPSVSDLSLSCGESEVLCLLGRNGCGKTTTVQMIAGRLAPSAGHVERAAGASVGWCPQHDILWPDVSVRDTLAVYAAVKGVPAGAIPAEAVDWAGRAGLSEKLDALAGTLSGGQRRRLSLAVALLGGSRLLLLDEPTAGVDPANRRLIWDVISNHKRGRAVILTTHFLDEAEALGDRVAILQSGVLRADGTPIFLKRALGFGYNLTIVRATGGAGGETLLARVKQEGIPAARLVPTEGIGRDVVVALPLDANPVLPALLRALESDAAAFGIEAVGISSASLHDVFMHFAGGASSAATPAAFAPAPSSGQQRGGAGLTRPGGALQSASSDITGRPATAHPSSVAVAVLPDVAAPPSLGPREANKGPEQRLSGAAAWLVRMRALLSKRLLVAGKDVKVTLLPHAIMAVAAVAVVLSFRSQEPIGCPVSLAVAPKAQPLTSLLSSYPRPFGPSRALAVVQGSMQPPFPAPSGLVNASSGLGLVEMLRTTPGSVWGGLDAASSSSSSAPAVVAYDIALPLADVASLNVLSNAIASRAGAGPVFVTAQAFPYTLSAFSSRDWSSFLVLLGVLLIAFSATGPIASTMLVARERVSGLKIQQRMSGVSAFQYWLAHAAVDAPLVALLALVAAAGVTSVPAWLAPFGPTFLAFFVFGLASAAWGYALSFATESQAGAVALHGGLSFFAAVGFVASYVTASPDPMGKPLVGQAITLAGLAAHPLAALIMGVIVPGSNMVYALCRSDSTRDLAFGGGARGAGAWLSLPAFGLPLAAMAAHAVLAFTVTLLLEDSLAMRLGLRSACGGRLPSVPTSATAPASAAAPGEGEGEGEKEEDEDVLAERRRVEAAYGSGRRVDGDEVVMSGVRKTFWVERAPVKAVRGVTLGLGANECFGHLGVNGAGKTTLLRILSGQELPSAGSVRVHGHDLASDLRGLQRSIGVCPQFDCLYGELSALAHLRLFAALKGLRPGPETEAEAARLLDALDLTEHAHKPSAALSGGNRRKLSVALALVGDPPVVILDEPSTGMDPSAKRFMWTVIASLTRAHTVILTTHSMEECEAVAQRVGVMVGGKLAALGSLARLKERFGATYHVDVVCGTAEEAARAAQALVGALPGSVVAEEHGRQLRLAVPRAAGGGGGGGGSLSIASVFETVEALAGGLGVRAYQVSQASLEDIFLQLAGGDAAAGGGKKGRE
jgi:ATP-binding cassette subfamily A (ABC1) protein 3